MQVIMYKNACQQKVLDIIIHQRYSNAQCILPSNH